jgi:hypothetical protein
MAATKYPESEFMIPRDERLAHAIVGTAKNLAAGLPGLAEWAPGKLDRTPQVIYDINGLPLFYDFRVGRGDVTFGYVRMTASRLLGSSVIASEMGVRRWSFESAARKLAPRVRKEFAGATVSPPKLVCYSYPTKLGVQFDIDGPRGKGRAIFDVASLARVPEMRDNDRHREGFVAWSFYDSLSDKERRSRLARFSKVEKDVSGLSARQRKALLAARTIGVAVDVLKLAYSRTSTKLLQYCSHYGYTHARSHHCFSLHGQQVDDYCAVATCQMILCYYRYYHSQDQIAPALGYSDGSGCPADQSPGYKSLTCNHLDSSFDSSATWEKARDQINLLRPMKSGIPGHARACAGYSSTWWVFGAGLQEKKLYIYDPWPWNADYAQAGAVVWEDWDAVSHTNYVYANVDCP